MQSIGEKKKVIVRIRKKILLTAPGKSEIMETIFVIILF